MGKLTTHILDTANGLPADNVAIELYRLADGERQLLKTTTTNADGRCDGPLLQDDEFKKSEYELVFHAGDYFAKKQTLPEPRFLNQVVIRFGIADPNEHYHVPLLVSPYSFSTYRGS